MPLSLHGKEQRSFAWTEPQSKHHKLAEQLSITLVSIANSHMQNKKKGKYKTNLKNNLSLSLNINKILGKMRLMIKSTA